MPATPPNDGATTGPSKDTAESQPSKDTAKPNPCEEKNIATGMATLVAVDSITKVVKYQYAENGKTTEVTLLNAWGDMDWHIWPFPPTTCSIQDVKNLATFEKARQEIRESKGDRRQIPGEWNTGVAERMEVALARSRGMLVPMGIAPLLKSQQAILGPIMWTVIGASTTSSPEPPKVLTFQSMTPSYMPCLTFQETHHAPMIQETSPCPMLRTSKRRTRMSLLFCLFAVWGEQIRDVGFTTLRNARRRHEAYIL